MVQGGGGALEERGDGGGSEVKLPLLKTCYDYARIFLEVSEIIAFNTRTSLIFPMLFCAKNSVFSKNSTLHKVVV